MNKTKKLLILLIIISFFSSFGIFNITYGSTKNKLETFPNGKKFSKLIDDSLKRRQDKPIILSNLKRDVSKAKRIIKGRKTKKFIFLAAILNYLEERVDYYLEKQGILITANEEKRQAEIARQRKLEEEKRQAEIARQRKLEEEKRQAEIARQRKLEEEKRQAEIARQKRQAEIAKQKRKAEAKEKARTKSEAS